MLQDIGLHVWNVLWKMLFRHISALKISDIQLRNRKCYFWTKTKWTIVIYFWIIKETSILSFLMYYNIECTIFCLKTKQKNFFKITFFPEGGLNPWPLVLKFTAFTSRPKDLTQDINKMMEQSNVCCIWKSQFLIFGCQDFSKSKTHFKYFKNLP